MWRPRRDKPPSYKDAVSASEEDDESLPSYIEAEEAERSGVWEDYLIPNIEENEEERSSSGEWGDSWRRDREEEANRARVDDYRRARERNGEVGEKMEIERSINLDGGENRDNLDEEEAREFYNAFFKCCAIFATISVIILTVLVMYGKRDSHVRFFETTPFVQVQPSPITSTTEGYFSPTSSEVSPTTSSTSEVYSAAPTSEVYASSPTSEVYSATLISEVYSLSPTSEVHSSLPTSEVYSATPTSEVYSSSPDSEVYSATPTSEVYSSSPTSEAYSSSPTSEV